MEDQAAPVDLVMPRATTRAPDCNSCPGKRPVYETLHFAMYKNLLLPLAAVCTDFIADRRPSSRTLAPRTNRIDDSRVSRLSAGVRQRWVNLYSPWGSGDGHRLPKRLVSLHPNTYTPTSDASVLRNFNLHDSDERCSGLGPRWRHPVRRLASPRPWACYNPSRGDIPPILWLTSARALGHVTPTLR